MREWGTADARGVKLIFGCGPLLATLDLVWPTWNTLLGAHADGFSIGPVFSRDTPGAVVLMKRGPTGDGVVLSVDSDDGTIRAVVEISDAMVAELRARRSWVARLVGGEG